MGNLTNKILAAQYKLALPDPRLLEREIREHPPPARIS